MEEESIDGKRANYSSFFSSPYLRRSFAGTKLLRTIALIQAVGKLSSLVGNVGQIIIDMDHVLADAVLFP